MPPVLNALRLELRPAGDEGQRDEHLVVQRASHLPHFHLLENATQLGDCGLHGGLVACRPRATCRHRVARDAENAVHEAAPNTRDRATAVIGKNLPPTTCHVTRTCLHGRRVAYSRARARANYQPPLTCATRSNAHARAARARAMTRVPIKSAARHVNQLIHALLANMSGTTDQPPSGPGGQARASTKRALSSTAGHLSSSLGAARVRRHASEHATNTGSVYGALLASASTQHATHAASATIARELAAARSTQTARARAPLVGRGADGAGDAEHAAIGAAPIPQPSLAHGRAALLRQLLPGGAGAAGGESSDHADDGSQAPSAYRVVRSPAFWAELPRRGRSWQPARNDGHNVPQAAQSTPALSSSPPSPPPAAPSAESDLRDDDGDGDAAFRNAARAAGAPVLAASSATEGATEGDSEDGEGIFAALGIADADATPSVSSAVPPLPQQRPARARSRDEDRTGLRTVQELVNGERGGT